MFVSAWRKYFGGKTPLGNAPRPARARLRLEGLEERWCPATYQVNPGQSIQAALNAAAAHTGNDMVVVMPGTYTEQLVINDNSAVTLKGSNNFVLQSPAATQARYNAAIGGEAIEVLSKNVTLQNFTVDGSAGDGNLYAGIRVVDDGSATIKNTTVTGLNTSSSEFFGIGIQVGTINLAGAAGKGTAKIDNNTITAYSGAGVLVTNNSSATVTNNTITGRGANNGGRTEYGVQVSYDASARVEHNNISGNDHGTGGSGVQSAGIDVFDKNDVNSPNDSYTSSVVVSKNNVFGNQDGILVEGVIASACDDSVEIVNNDVYSNTGYAGIDVVDSQYVEVENNDVFNNASFNGIALTGASHNEIENNDVKNNTSADGIYLFQSDCNTINCNDANGNGANGVFLEESSNNVIWNNDTKNNVENGIKVLGGSSNDVWLGTSSGNGYDGVLLSYTSCNTVVLNTLTSNQGWGVRLDHATGSFIALNTIQHNGAGSIYLDEANSTGTISIGNRTDSPPVKDDFTVANGALGTSAASTSAVAAADTAVSSLFEYAE